MSQMLMRKWKRVSALGGIAIVAVAIAFPALVQRQPTYGPESTVEVSAGFSMPTACPFCWAYDQIVIRYPSRMQVNESKTVEVMFSAKGPKNGKLSKYEGKSGWLSDHYGDRLLKPLALSLAGAAFAISPSSRIEKQAGSPLPVQWSWSISPQKEGEQRLLLDLDSVGLAAYGALQGSGTLPSLSVTVNGVPKDQTTFANLRSETLKILVLTREGLPLGTYLLIRYTLALVGFLLLYPAVATLVTEYVKRRKQRRQPTIIVP